MNVSVVIPVWNKWELTRNCLMALREHAHQADVEVLVVDNGSQDETATDLDQTGRELFQDRFKSIRLPENKGFAVACNEGARAASGKYLFFLNNDTVVTSGFLAPLLEAFGQSQARAVGPLLLYPDTLEVQHCGVVYSPFLEAMHLYRNFPARHPAVQRYREVQALTGAALMLEKSLFWEHEGFCTLYTNGYEDLDLCCRLRQKGVALHIVAQSIVYHLESQTPGRQSYESHNLSTFMERCGQSIIPDWHTSLLHDGYQLQYTELFMGYASLTPSNEASLNTKNATSTHDEILQEIQHEPLWFGGYLKLIESFESARSFDAALYLWQKLMLLCPQYAYIRKALRLAQAAGNERYIGTFSQYMSTFAVRARHKAQYREKAIQAFRAASKAKNKELAALFQDWLKAYPE